MWFTAGNLFAFERRSVKKFFDVSSVDPGVAINITGIDEANFERTP